MSRKDYGELADRASAAADEIWDEIFEEKNPVFSLLKFLWLCPALLDNISKMIRYSARDVWSDDN